MVSVCTPRARGPAIFCFATLSISESEGLKPPTITVESSASPFSFVSSYFTCFGAPSVDLKSCHDVREPGLLRAVLLTWNVPHLLKFRAHGIALEQEVCLQELLLLWAIWPWSLQHASAAWVLLSCFIWNTVRMFHVEAFILTVFYGSSRSCLYCF